MTRRIFARLFPLAAAALALSSLPASANGSKPENMGVTFHLETGSEDNPKMIFSAPIGGETKYFRRIPEVGTKDIEAFNPFPTEDGSSYGVIFKLGRGATNRLSGVSTANIGKWMLAMVNGRPVDALMIDQQVNDGYIVIWKGITLAEIREYDKIAPRINDLNKEKDKKKKK